MNKLNVDVYYTDEDDMVLTLRGSRAEIEEGLSWSDLLEMLEPLDENPSMRLNFGEQSTERLTIVKEEENPS